MQEIKAVIQPFLLAKVVEALKRIEGLPGLTVSEVHGFGRARAVNAPNRVIHDGVEYVKKSKLEIVVADSIVDTVVETICSHARTGNPGDGKIFVSPVSEVVKIRSGERGERAI